MHILSVLLRGKQMKEKMCLSIHLIVWMVQGKHMWIKKYFCDLIFFN